MRARDFMLLFGIPEKRFGLYEAEAAMRFVGDKTQMRPVLAVVCGVLGYKNAVAEDVESEKKDMEFKNALLNQTAGEKICRIEELKAQIEGLKLEIARCDGRVARLSEIGDLFKIAD